VLISHPILTTIPQQQQKKIQGFGKQILLEQILIETKSKLNVHYFFNTYSLMFHLDKSHVLSTYESLSMGSLIGWTGEPSHNGRGLLNVG